MHAFDEKLLNVSIVERGRCELKKDLTKEESEKNSQTGGEKKTHSDNCGSLEINHFRSNKKTIERFPEWKKKWNRCV